MRTQHDSMMFKATGGSNLDFVMDNKCPLGVLLEARCSKDFSELAQWLRAIDSEEVAARPVGTGAVEAIEDAPGSYVKVRSA